MTAFDAKWFYANHTATSSTISTSTAIDQSTSSPSSSIPQAHLRSSNEVRSDHGMNKMNKVVLKKRKIQMESNSTAPEPAPLPLRFRTSQRCYSSECLLVSYDLHRAMHPEGRRPKILINPNVRVGEWLTSRNEHSFQSSFRRLEKRFADRRYYLFSCFPSQHTLTTSTTFMPNLWDPTSLPHGIYFGKTSSPIVFLAGSLN